VPDEMLRTIGMIVVMAVQVDFLRMRLLEVMTSDPVKTTASFTRV
jgi:hypothetical protein